MKERYLEVMFRKGKPFAAYLFLWPMNGAHTVRAEEEGHGMVIKYGADNRPIGIELNAPDKVTLDRLNTVLKRLNLPPMKEEPTGAYTALDPSEVLYRIK